MFKMFRIFETLIVPEPCQWERFRNIPEIIYPLRQAQGPEFVLSYCLNPSTSSGFGNHFSLQNPLNILNISSSSVTLPVPQSLSLSVI